MPNITLPDGKKLSFSEKVTGTMIVEKISKSLAKEALIMSVNGDLKDLSFEIENDSEVKILTSKDNDGLDTIRHDTAHILAMAVQELFPGTQVTIGPTIENGFYYDFDSEIAFTPEILEKIETEMKKIIKENQKFERIEVSRDEAKKLISEIGQETYKLGRLSDIPEGEELDPGEGMIMKISEPEIGFNPWMPLNKNPRVLIKLDEVITIYETYDEIIDKYKELVEATNDNGTGLGEPTYIPANPTDPDDEEYQNPSSKGEE